MKTICKQAALALVVGLIPAAMAVAQVNVTPNAAGGTTVQAPGATVQTLPGGANVNVAPGTGQAIIDNAPARQENRIERREIRQANRAADWRMVNHQNRWWYYHPNNTWSYYNQGQWTPYRAAPVTAAQPMPRRFSSGYRGIAPAPVAPAPANAAPAINNTNTLPNGAAVNPIPRGTGVQSGAAAGNLDSTNP